MPDAPSASNIILKMLIESANKMALPIDDLLHQMPSNSHMSANEKIRVPVEVISSVWRWFSLNGQDKNIGFKLAQQTPLISQTMLTYMMMSSKDLRSALDNLIKYQGFICESVGMKIKQLDRQCAIEFNFLNDEEHVVRQQSEYAFLLIHHWFKELLGEVWQLDVIHFSHSQPDDISEHKTLFGCDITFSQNHNTVIFDAQLLEAPIRYANEQMNDLLQKKAQKLTFNIEQGKSVSTIISLIRHNLASGEVNINTIAQQSGLSERQLKSVLEQQGTHLSEIVRYERKILAKKLLCGTHYSIAEISDACGFAEPSIFNRAFKRWFACTPSEFRQNQGNIALN